MNNFLQEKFQKLRNIGRLRNLGGSRKNRKSDDLELSDIQNDSAEDAQEQGILNIKTLTILDCSNIQETIEQSISTNHDNEIEDQHVLLLRIYTDEELDGISPNYFQNMNRIYANKSIVILVTSNNKEQFSICWKSRELQNFLVFKRYSEEFTKNDEIIYEYIADYLSNSLSKGELGLCSEWLQHSNEIEVGSHLLADSRGYNLLIIAAEAGNAEIVKILLDLGVSTVADDGVSAQSLAWKNRHSEVLLVLAQANLPYPEGIDINQLSNEFRKFYKKTEELHEAINAKSEEKVKEILNRDQNLEFYFDLSNKSAARVAVDAKAFNIYEVLVIHEIFLAPHEYQQGVFYDLEKVEQRIIRELHHKHSKDLPEKHINILMAHSSIAHDATDTHDKLKHVYKAYKYLSQDPRLSTILKVVAASKKFQIIYDFNRDAVNIADPTVSDNTEGVFYPMGRIYIGAKQLLDESTRCKAIATLAHELCHNAVNIVYSNMARPYKDNDNKIMQEFEEVNEKCQKEQGKEEIVDLVYECYPTDMYHAELIVRPAHMIAMYLDQPEKLAECGKIFPKLFEFFDRIIKEMEGAIPEIEKRDEVILEKKDKKISRLRKKLVLSVIFLIIGIIADAAIVALIFYKPFYSFKELSATNKLLIKNGLVTYKNVEVRFRDLFPENSTAYEKLTSDHISQILDGHALNFSDSHFLYLNDLIHHDWQNLTKNLKQKFLTSNFTFQNESLKFEKLKEINSEVFNSLTSEQIVDVLDGKELVVGHMIENKTEFYVERRFVLEEDGKLDIVRGVKNKVEKGSQKVEQTTIAEGMGGVVEISKMTSTPGVIGTNKLTRTSGVGEMNTSISTKRDEETTLDTNSTENLKYETIESNLRDNSKSSDEIIQETMNEGIFILSSKIGSGKTVTFKEFTMRIKKKFPTKWVSYIDFLKLEIIISAYDKLNTFEKAFDDTSNHDKSKHSKNCENYSEVNYAEASSSLARIPEYLSKLSKKLVVNPNNYEEVSEDLVGVSKDLIEILGKLHVNSLCPTHYKEISESSQDRSFPDIFLEFMVDITNLHSKNQFEFTVFKNFFKSGHVVLLWDNFDELSLKNRKIVNTLLNSIQKFTKNVQFIASMPLFASQLHENLGVKIYELVPFTESEQKLFFKGFFSSQNLTQEKIENFTEGAFNISKTLQLDSPLMQKFIAQNYETDKLYQSPNFYNICHQFVSQQIKMWSKSKSGKNLTSFLLTKSTDFDMMKMYQRIAFQKELDLNLGSNLTKPDYKHFNKLEILKIKIPKILPIEVIARMGILSFKTETDYKFLHKTIADFFLAKYFIDNLYSLEDNVSMTENGLRVEIFRYLLDNYEGSEMVVTLIRHYLKANDENRNGNKEFFEILKGANI